VLRAIAAPLASQQFVRVKLGAGSGVERKEAARQLAEALDCVCVHQVGFTVTLWRQKGLPPTHAPLQQQLGAGAPQPES
jgi:RNA-binding protein YhbY